MFKKKRWFQLELEMHCNLVNVHVREKAMRNSGDFRVSWRFRETDK